MNTVLCCDSRLGGVCSASAWALTAALAAACSAETLMGCISSVKGDAGLNSMEDSSALVTRYPGTVTLWPFMKMWPWVIICLACLMVLASPFS